MTRPTRAEAQARNRETVLEVAAVAFLRDGYVTTSLASVATEAGFTTGIVYSGFGSKADLALEVADAIQGREIRALTEHLRAASSSDDALARVKAWSTAALHSGWVRFELELLLDTIGDERLAAAQAARQERATAQAVEVVRAVAPDGALPDRVVETLAEAAVDYAIGVAVRTSVNRDVSPDHFLALIGPLVTFAAAR